MNEIELIKRIGKIIEAMYFDPLDFVVYCPDIFNRQILFKLEELGYKEIELDSIIFESGKNIEIGEKFSILSPTLKINLPIICFDAKTTAKLENVDYKVIEFGSNILESENQKDIDLRLTVVILNSFENSEDFSNFVDQEINKLLGPKTRSNVLPSLEYTKR